MKLITGKELKQIGECLYFKGCDTDRARPNINWSSPVKLQEYGRFCTEPFPIVDRETTQDDYTITTVSIPITRLDTSGDVMMDEELFSLYELEDLKIIKDKIDELYITTLLKQKGDGHTIVYGIIKHNKVQYYKNTEGFMELTSILKDATQFDVREEGIYDSIYHKGFKELYYGDGSDDVVALHMVLLSMKG